MIVLMDLFVLPSHLAIKTDKARRTIKTSVPIVHQYYYAKSYRQVNKTVKSSFYYMVAYDNEWFDTRLIAELQAALIYSRNIDMFVVFIAPLRADTAIYQPRIFNSKLELNPDEKQPLPYNSEKLKFEKLIGGWLYVD